MLSPRAAVLTDRLRRVMIRVVSQPYRHKKQPQKQINLFLRLFFYTYAACGSRIIIAWRSVRTGAAEASSGYAGCLLF